MSVPVLAIDGPSGSGKGTIARRVAADLGWNLLDSGALYRLTGLAAARHGSSFSDEAALAALAAGLDLRFESTADGDERIFLEGDDVTAEVRTEETGRLASRVAACAAVRTALLKLQRDFRRPPGLVADGRDMGTHVFPDAAVKVFLTASPDVRAKRRYKQLKAKGIGVNLAALSRDISERDQRDSERSVAPLRPADDARVLDTSEMTIDDVVRTVVGWVGDDCS